MSAAQQLSNNGFCTQIGNAHFTAFATTTSKSRLNLDSRRRGNSAAEWIWAPDKLPIRCVLEHLTKRLNR
jgi:hypothetical protein